MRGRSGYRPEWRCLPRSYDLMPRSSQIHSPATILLFRLKGFGGGEEVAGFGGDVALEAADELASGFGFGLAAGGVGLGWRGRGGGGRWRCAGGRCWLAGRCRG